MATFQIFNIAGSAMAAQSVRLNTVASNLANADTVASSADAAYRAREPVFVTEALGGDDGAAAVRVDSMAETGAAPQKRFEPGNPMADADGYVYASNVNTVEEMVNMISTARSYQNAVDVLNTSKDLMLRTLSLGKSS